MNSAKEKLKHSGFIAFYLMTVGIYQLIFDPLYQNIFIDMSYNDKILFYSMPLIFVFISILVLIYKSLIISLIGISLTLPYAFQKILYTTRDIRMKYDYSVYQEGIDKDVYKTDTSHPGIKFMGVNQALEKTALYLLNSIKDSGEFVYLTNINPLHQSPTNQYNILRHANTVYTIVKYFGSMKNDPIPQEVFKSVDWLKSKIVKLEGTNEIMAVWSSSVNDDTEIDQAKLGGTALTLFALLELEKSSPGFSDPKLIQSLGHFLLYMQRPDGSFYHRFIPEYGGRTSIDHSPFYNGQALGALCLLYEYYADSTWINAVVKGMNFKVMNQKNNYSATPDVWMLQAINKLPVDYFNSRTEKQKKELKEYISNECAKIFRFYFSNDEGNFPKGCLSHDGRTTFTASCLEGLLSVYNHLSEDKALKQKAEVLIEECINFLLSAQLNNGAFPYAIKPNEYSYPDFMEKAGELRIDYTQHVMNTLLEYKIIFMPAGELTINKL